MTPNTNHWRPDRRTVLKALAAGAAVAGLASGRSGANAGDGDDEIPTALRSAIEIDAENDTVTLPMFRGRGPDGGDVYYVLTESSDLEAALGRGLNWSPKLANALGSPAVQTVTGRDGDEPAWFNPHDPGTTFAGTVDFGPDREVVPGPEGFPLDADATRPGAVGDDAYSPLVTTGDGIVHNAPQVANDTGVHDSVVGEPDTSAMQVTLGLVEGFYEDRRTLYISTDAYPADVAALEGATFADALTPTPTAGDRDLESSAREPIVPVVNGPTGADNDERQGLRSAVAGEGSPLNITRSEQTCADPSDPTDCSLHYSPLWDVHPVVWTDAAIDAGRRRRLTSHEAVVELILAGDVESAADGPANTQFANIHAAVAAVNCPIVWIEPEAEADGGDDGGGGEGDGGMGDDG